MKSISLVTTLPRGAVIGSQRERILDAIVEVVAERGCAGASVGLIAARARVSRRTYNEQFAGLEDGLVAVMERTLEQVSMLAADAFEREKSWLDGMRWALASVLMFFDSDPMLARVCLVETLVCGPLALEQRERIVAAFRDLIFAQIQGQVSIQVPLLTEGVLASVMSVVRARLIAPDPPRLVTLVGPFMGMITEFLGDPQLTAEEVRCGDRLAQEVQANDPIYTRGDSPKTESILPSIIANPTARRARECVRFLADNPDCGNREIAAGIGVSHESQISKLLSSLCRDGLIVKHSLGVGRRNAWRLTSYGEQILTLIS